MLVDMIWKMCSDGTSNLIKSLNGQIILIKGKHDRFLHNEKVKNAPLAVVKDYEDICVTLEDDTRRRCILSYYFIPMYNRYRYQAVRLHGHSCFTDETDIEVNLRRDSINKDSIQRYIMWGVCTGIMNL